MNHIETLCQINHINYTIHNFRPCRPRCSFGVKKMEKLHNNALLNFLRMWYSINTHFYTFYRHLFIHMWTFSESSWTEWWVSYSLKFVTSRIYAILLCILVSMSVECDDSKLFSMNIFNLYGFLGLELLNIHPLMLLFYW